MSFILLSLKKPQLKTTQKNSKKLKKTQKNSKQLKKKQKNQKNSNNSKKSKKNQNNPTKSKKKLLKKKTKKNSKKVPQNQAFPSHSSSEEKFTMPRAISFPAWQILRASLRRNLGGKDVGARWMWDEEEVKRGLNSLIFLICFLKSPAGKRTGEKHLYTIDIYRLNEVTSKWFKRLAGCAALKRRGWQEVVVFQVSSNHLKPTPS